ncbi:MAG: histidine kinase [Hyphomicrobium sp.]
MTFASRPLLFVVAAAFVGGCSGASLPSIGSINPFSSSNSIADSDRVFLMAAGSWDRNRDNTVTCDEWKAYANELFTGADGDQSDALDATEWSRMVAIDRLFETADMSFFDANKDGKVARSELTEKKNPAFRLLDTSNTCSLNATQIAGARSKTQYDVSGKPKESGDPRDATNPAQSPDAIRR